MKFKKFMATVLTIASVAAMTAIPAFADTIGINENKNSVDTNINVETQVSDVSIVIPTSFDIIFNSDNNESTTPSNFIIRNASNTNIYVDSVTLQANDDWELLDENYPSSRINNDSKEVIFTINNKYLNPEGGQGKTATLQFEDPNTSTNPDNVIRIDSDNTANFNFQVYHGAFSNAFKAENAFTMTTKFKFMK